MAAATLRSRLDAGDTLYLAWASLPSPLNAEAMAQGGWDGVVVDMQHGLMDYDQMVMAIAGIYRCGSVPLVRVPVNDDALIGRAPDAGAQGVICPMINSGQDAAWLAKACKYPPLGQRSWAPGRAVQLMDTTLNAYLAEANAITLTLAMIETRNALRNIDAICSTEGIDAVFVGTNDLSVSLTEGQLADPTHPEVFKALELIVRKCEAHDVVPGAYANTPDIARQYRALGFRIIAVASDEGFLMAGSKAALQRVLEDD